MHQLKILTPENSLYILCFDWEVFFIVSNKEIMDINASKCHLTKSKKYLIPYTVITVCFPISLDCAGIKICPNVLK